MSYTLILAQIDTVLDGVSDTENVYDYPRFTNDLATLDSRYINGGKFHFWFIERVGTTSEGHLGSDVERTHLFDLLHFYAVDDTNSSYKTFHQRLDNVMNTFDLLTNRTLSDTAKVMQPAVLLDASNVMYPPGDGGVLCHFGRIRISVLEILSC